MTSLGTVRLGLGAFPRGVGSGQVLGGAALSGIGFTVSLLIADLAFDEHLQSEATVGVLLAAALATLTGWVIFKGAAVLRGERTATLPLFLDRPVDPEQDHIRGNPDAPLTLVEYGDFECPFCSRATGTVKELHALLGDDLRYVFRHLPLPDVHDHSELAAQAAEAAGAQGAFWEMHDLLFAHQDRLEYEDLRRVRRRARARRRPLRRRPPRGTPRGARPARRGERRRQRRARDADVLRGRPPARRPVRRPDPRRRAERPAQH